ncbi:MAG: hypothetical protein WCE23_06295 [Candidatus Binatus sp.]|uniref:hypothetical protein n=1 Tax=Candidatus Binatus sp. TaxID=2811406 RepID=UPI003C73C114
MRNVFRATLTTILFFFFAAIAWAQPSAVPASNATSEGQPGFLVIQEDVLIPLIGQPEYYFHMASKDFARGDRIKAAAEIRAGAAMVKFEAARHDATNKTGLEDAAKHLDDLAAGVATGTVKSPKELSDAFFRADVALARHYHQMAEASVAQNQHEKTGYWLEGSADSLDDGAEWSGHKLEAGGKATVNGARSLGRKLEGGAEWTGDEVKKAVSDLGSEIESLGGRT